MSHDTTSVVEAVHELRETLVEQGKHLIAALALLQLILDESRKVNK